jgi:REP element-mobilizing transposase RayT
MSVISEKFRERIEKYITVIVNNNACKMYAIYANPEHVHFLVSRSPQLDEESLATIVANSSEKVYQRQSFMRRDISMATVMFGVFGIQT